MQPSNILGEIHFCLLFRTCSAALVEFPVVEEGPPPPPPPVDFAKGLWLISQREAISRASLVFS